jgi:hypothetical protein
MRRLQWLWPAVIIVSTVVADVVVDVDIATAIRPLVVMWFLCACPGMVLVRFFPLADPVFEWTLALALSLSVDGLVAGTWLYAGKWSPGGIFDTLAIFCLAGAVAQFSLARALNAYGLAERS